MYRHTDTRTYMDPRTLRKIIKKITSNPLRPHDITRINGYRYLITYVKDSDVVMADPLSRSYGEGGAFRASTHDKLDSNTYREGGEVYKKALEWCHEIHNEIKKLRKGSG